MTTQEINNVLNRMISFDNRAFRYELCFFEDWKQRTRQVYIIKYNFENFLDEIDLLYRGEHKNAYLQNCWYEDRKKAELSVKKNTSIYWNCEEYTEDFLRGSKINIEEQVSNNCFLRLLRDLNDISHKELVLKLNLKA